MFSSGPAIQGSRVVVVANIGAPSLGSAEGGFVPSSDFPCFLPISLFSSDLFRFAFLFRNTPICSDLLRFLPICFQNKPEQIRETPFCRPLLQVPENIELLWDTCCQERPAGLFISMCVSLSEASHKCGASPSKTLG